MTGQAAVLPLPPALEQVREPAAGDELPVLHEALLAPRKLGDEHGA